MPPVRPSTPWRQRQATDEDPLRLNLKLRESDPIASAILAELGLVKQRARQMALTILANFAGNPRKVVFYSRDRNFYAGPVARRYLPNHCTYAATMAAVAALVQAGLTEEARTSPSARATSRSTLRASSRLLAMLGSAGKVDVAYLESDPIVLRRSGKSKKLLDYSDTQETCAMRDDVREHNAFLSGFAIDLEGVSPDSKWDPHANQYYRVFNDDFDRGGRWYGPSWQVLSKAERSRLTIDGKPTVELDIKCCQPRLLCANAGLEVPFDDPAFDFYQLPGFQRVEVKRAFNILLNSTSHRQARSALLHALQREGLPCDGMRAAKILKGIVAAWPQLASYWCSGVGLQLQRIDADICTQVQAELRRQGIPVLSIHDSFVVRVADRAILQQTMDAAMADACRRLRDNPIKISRQRKGFKKTI